MPKKLLIFHPTIAPYRIDFFNDLYKNFDARIVLDYWNLKDQKFNYEEIVKQFLFQPNYLKKWFSVGKRDFYRGHARHIREFNPDIVIVGEYGLAMWIAIMARFFSRKKYKIVTICDDSLKIAKECSGIRKKSRELALPFLDGIILCNPAAQEWYSHHTEVETFCFPIIHSDEKLTEKLSVSYWQVPSDIKKYDLAGKKVFLFVGRLSPEKNVEYLVKSFIAASKKHEDIVLLIVGDDGNTDGTVRRNIESMISEAHCGCIKLLGRKEGRDLYSIYNCGQVLVLPSYYEPFGAVTNEALAAGEYVMISQNAGSSCLVTKDNGEVIDIEKPYIDFENMISKVNPIQKNWIPRKSKMPVSYHVLINDFDAWICSY